ncbi:DUF5906 domain-containing protein [Faecalibaculum rodentium]|jgi:putative DNA primase/helicase|uniref:DUF5906 domain-containing protein n=1 Tax=Faecalibaculum rodentium TaxID=1702221 RepID=UPI00249302D7|nr:DUF5906 domain-containing protein [Faecalibaculum rodentium]
MPFIEFQPGEKYAKPGADKSDFTESFQDCGYLLTNDEIVIDIDHLPKESIRELCKTFDIKTQIVWTNRGAHLYFKKPPRHRRTDGVCRLGFEIEELTCTNRPNGVTVKRDGVLREIENAGAREALPDIFTVSKRFEDLTGLSEGDGRNRKLYTHKMKLNNCEDWFRIIRFINEHVFDEPLPQKEFDSLSRAEQSEGDQKTTNEADVAEQVIREFKCAKWASQVWFWSEKAGKFISDDEELAAIIAKRIAVKDPNKVEKAMKWLRINAKKYPADYIFKIRLRNGFLADGKFTPIVVDDFTPHCIDIDYNPDAEPVPAIDEYLDQIVNEPKYTQQDMQDYRNRLIEIMAYGLIVNPERVRVLSKFHILRGEGSNGKGTFLEIMKTIYQPENCSTLSIEDLADATRINSLTGKLVNLGDDVEDKPIGKTQFKHIKNITSADTVTIRRLYKEAESVVLQAKLIYTSNSDLRTFDKGHALERRMCWVPMFNTVRKPDPNFITKMTTPEALEYWMKLMVEAYVRLYKHGWTESKICADYNGEYHRHNDISKMFIEELEKDDFRYKTRQEVLDMFDKWNTDDDRKLNMRAFKQNIWLLYRMGFGVNTRQGKSAKVLMEQCETKQNLKPTFK